MKFHHFTATPILCEITFWWIQNGSKRPFLAISETLNFEFLVNLGLKSCSNLLKSKFRNFEMTFLDRLNSPKIDFTSNLNRGKMIKFQQSQASTSHFESFWSIVQYCNCFNQAGWKHYSIIGGTSVVWVHLFLCQSWALLVTD